jgi:hypothetical protein
MDINMLMVVLDMLMEVTEATHMAPVQHKLKLLTDIPNVNDKGTVISVC